MKAFWDKYKVVIIGVLSAIALAVHDLIHAGEADTKVLVWAGVIAGVSWLSRNLRGQWATIAGIIGTALTTYISQEQTGDVSWIQIVGQALALFLATQAPPAKSRGYERTHTIQQAKIEGEQIVATPASPSPPTSL